MNKELLIKKAKEELKLIKTVPMLFISGVIAATIVLEIVLSIAGLNAMAAMNNRLHEKNVLLIERDEQISQLLNQVRELKDCVINRSQEGCL